MEGGKELTFTVFEGEDDCFQWGDEALLEATVRKVMDRDGVSKKQALSHVLSRAIYEDATMYLGEEEAERIWATARKARRAQEQGNKALPGKAPTPDS